MEKLVYFSTRINDEIKLKMKVEAAKKGIKMQDLVSNIFKEWLQKNEEKEGE